MEVRMGRFPRGEGVLAFALLITLSLLAAAPVSALSWPVQHRVLLATFGENLSGQFHPGIDLGGGSQAVHAASPGRVIFTYQEGRDPRALPTGLGSFLVIQDSPVIRTLYAHLRKGSLVANRERVTPNDVVGRIGDTGDSAGLHLQFEVIDVKRHELLNPLTLLPPLRDRQKPVIASVSLLRGKKRIELKGGMRVRGGKTELVVDAYDPALAAGYFDPMAPYEIEASVNGRQLFKATYNALAEKKGKLRLVGADERGFRSYYVDTHTVRLGSLRLRPGVANIVVTVKDVGGNETTAVYDLTVEGRGGA